MLDKDKASEIFEEIKKYSSADELEILFYGGKSALTRFANNTIHQNVAEENYAVSVRTVFGGQTLESTTSGSRFIADAVRGRGRPRHTDPGPSLCRDRCHHP